jgi:hypothetical protein
VFPQTDAPSRTKLNCGCQHPYTSVIAGLSSHQQRLTVMILCSSFLRCSSSSPSHLSGRHASTSSPKVGRCRFTTYGFMPTTVPAAKYRPQMVTPPSGTSRSSGKQKGGCRRTASLTQASRYGSSLNSFHAGNGRERWP